MMNNYIKTIVTAVLAVGMVSVLFPKGNFGKYVNMLSSIIVMAAIAFPLLNISNSEVDFDVINTESIEIKANSYIMEEFEKELAKNIENELKMKTDIKFSVTVFADKKEDVIEIKKIEIKPYSKKYAQMISQYTGIEEDRISEK